MWMKEGEGKPSNPLAEGPKDFAADVSVLFLALGFRRSLHSIKASHHTFRPGANPWRVINQIRTKLRMPAVAVQVLFGVEDQSRGRWKAIYNKGHKGDSPTSFPLLPQESCPCDGEIEVPARPQSRTSSVSGHRLSNSVSGLAAGTCRPAVAIMAALATARLLREQAHIPRYLLSARTHTALLRECLRHLLNDLTAVHDSRQAAARHCWGLTDGPHRRG
jgi:hypothetical protein